MTIIISYRITDGSLCVLVTFQWRPAGDPAPTLPGREPPPRSPGRWFPLRSEQRSPAGWRRLHRAAGHKPAAKCWRQERSTPVSLNLQTVFTKFWIGNWTRDTQKDENKQEELVVTVSDECAAGLVPVCSSCNIQSCLQLRPLQPERRTARPEDHSLLPPAVRDQTTGTSVIAPQLSFSVAPQYLIHQSHHSSICDLHVAVCCVEIIFLSIV